jgi:hypothetical protein
VIHRDGSWLAVPGDRPIPRIDSPALYLRQSSAYWAAVNIRGRPNVIAITSLSQTTIGVFRRPLETAAQMCTSRSEGRCLYKSAPSMGCRKT